MGRELVVGDRFKSGSGDVTWEFAGDVWTCVESLRTYYKLGDTIRYSMQKNPHDDRYWTYLGNFSKQDNFDELYNLMNE